LLAIYESHTRQHSAYADNKCNIPKPKGNTGKTAIWTDAEAQILLLGWPS